MPDMTRSSLPESLKSQCEGLTPDQLTQIEYMRAILTAMRDDGAIAAEVFIDSTGLPHVCVEWPAPLDHDEDEEA